MCVVLIVSVYAEIEIGFVGKMIRLFCVAVCVGMLRVPLCFEFFLTEFDRFD